MTAQRNPYVRVYYSVVDDPKFTGVYDDDASLATWLRLLLVADGTYPAPAPVPHGVKRRILKRLVEAGLVDLAPGDRYRMHGLASERERRSLIGKAGANARWDADADANALLTHSDKSSTPSRDTPSRDTPSRDETDKGVLPLRGLDSARDSDGSGRPS